MYTYVLLYMCAIHIVYVYIMYVCIFHNISINSVDMHNPTLNWLRYPDQKTV